MNAHFRPLRLAAAACLAVGAIAAESTPPPASPKDEIKALVLEDAKNAAAKSASKSPLAAKAEKSGTPVGASATPTLTTTTASNPPVPAATPVAKADATSPAPVTSKPAEEPATLLPKVEVKKGRVTELDRQLHEQEVAIAREKKNLKSSEADKTLNDSKFSLPILGGRTTEYRTGIAKERITLMEEEKDLIEAIAQAKTKEEKQELQKYLEELKTTRRTLERTGK